MNENKMDEKVEYIVIARCEEYKFKMESDAIYFAKKQIEGEENFDTALIITRAIDVYGSAWIRSVHILHWIIGEAFILGRLNV